MDDGIYPTGRLIKVFLPSHLVGAMDEVIGSRAGYASRAEFIADAIDGHLAEMQLHQGDESNVSLGSDEAQPANQGDGPRSISGPRSVVAAIPALPKDTPTLRHDLAPTAAPTWGMHNRDFPTLWALTHLCQAVVSTGGPVPFQEWLPEAVADAWELGRRLPADKFDLSGFPTNRTKRDASEGRFVRFFLGDSPGKGPIFELALAGADEDDSIAPTEPGLDLLRELEGFSCERGRGIPEAWTLAYLRHLADYAPADLAFMAEVLNEIRRGHDDRAGLVMAIAGLHPDWSESVVDTNIAGFIARAREWGLVLRRQRKGKYVLEDDAIRLLEQVTEHDANE